MKGNFNKIINGEVPVLVDFSAEWCGPCKMQAPILSELSSEIEGKVRIIKIDIDKNADIARRYQIKSVPTLAFFKFGKLMWKESGLRTKTQLVELMGPQ